MSIRLRKRIIPALIRRVRRFVNPPRSGQITRNGITFDVDLSLDPAMESLYYGDFQKDVTRCLKRYLKEGDTFLDVGANIGFMTAFALGLVGEEGQVHSFEPVPRYFELLGRVKNLNPRRNLTITNAAVGSEIGTGEICVTSLRNIGWNTMVPGFMSEDTVSERVEVPIITLSQYLEEKQIEEVHCVKIDTEGFEFNVLRGFASFLKKAHRLPVILVEISPEACERLSVELTEFARWITDAGYVAYNLAGTTRVEVSDLDSLTDVVLLPADTPAS